jgi:hypothetical protein
VIVNDLTQALIADSAAAPLAHILEGVNNDLAHEALPFAPHTIDEELWHIAGSFCFASFVKRGRLPREVSAGNSACAQCQKTYNGGVGGLEGSHVLAPVTLTGRRNSFPSSVMYSQFMSLPAKVRLVMPPGSGGFNIWLTRPFASQT